MKPNLPCRLRVDRIHALAQDVIGLDLVAVQNDALEAWAAGAHIDIELADGLVRQYSLTGSSTDQSRYRIAILREAAGRGGSIRAHDLREGDEIAASAPRNHFELLAAPSYLFVAGGIGITPILAMIEAAEAQGAAWRLAYGGRSLASMAYASDLQARFGDKVALYPQDQSGHLPLAEIFAAKPAETLVYCCGPEPLLAAVEAQAALWANPEDLHLERFTAKAVEAPPSGERGFEVYCATSDITLQVPPDRSILEMLEGAGIEVMVSCCSGTCGTCETVVLDGIPDHRDSVLTKAEQAAGKTMLVCVSRALSDRITLAL